MRNAGEDALFGSNQAEVGDMTGEAFAAALERFSQWVVAFRGRVGELPVMSRVAPGEVSAALPVAAPLRGEPVEAWIADLDRLIVPALTHWNHPGFMAYFGITGSGPGILGELVTAALNVNGMVWKTSPALTELEQVVMGWYARAMGLPTSWFGMITDTASTSTLVALAAARERAWPGARENGLAGAPELVLYCSQEAHSSVDKAAIVLGLGARNVRHILSDDEFRMRPDVLREAIVADLAAGRRPMAVVATVGTTSATAVDPVPEIAECCAEHLLWLHVDAAYAGSAAVAPEFRWALAGCERADSLVANPHKWLFTPIDCSALFLARPADLASVFSLVPEYLRTDTGAAVNLMDYSFQLGRRFRALKLWFVFRAFGTEGIAARIRAHVELARRFASWVDRHPGLERLAPRHFSTVCFRVRGVGDESEDELGARNERVLAAVNATGEVFLSHTKLKGRTCLRIAIGNLATDEVRVRQAFDLVVEHAQLQPVQPGT